MQNVDASQYAIASIARIVIVIVASITLPVVLALVIFIAIAIVCIVTMVIAMFMCMFIAIVVVVISVIVIANAIVIAFDTPATCSLGLLSWSAVANASRNGGYSSGPWWSALRLQTAVTVGSCVIALSGGAGYANDAILATQRQKTIRSAVMLANSIEDAKLVVFTRTGEMADQTSHLRPERAPIFVFTSTQEAVRHQTMKWNTHAFHLDFTTDAEETFADAEKILIQQKLVASGEKLIVLRELIEGEERFESIQIRTVP
jgi:energy-coupling factor transporter transmembrane protein EcfT